MYTKVCMVLIFLRGCRLALLGVCDTTIKLQIYIEKTHSTKTTQHDGPTLSIGYLL